MDTVIREVTPGIWTFSRPFYRGNVIPVGGRSTAIKLKDGSVWFLASTELNQPTQARLDALGPVKYLIAPDAVHHLFIADYAQRYPQAKVIGVAALVEKKKDEVKFDGVYGRDPPGTKYGFEDEIKACYFSGFINKDVAFYHQASKTLIQADLLFNLPAREQHGTTSYYTQIFNSAFAFGPYSTFHKRFVWRAGKGSEEMKKDAKTVASWDFERIIPCHGDVIEKDGKKAWAAAYEWYLTA